MSDIRGMGARMWLGREGVKEVSKECREASLGQVATLDLSVSTLSG
jgi:hypothetical protein